MALRFRQLGVLLFLILGLLFLVTPAQAATPRNGETVTIAADETIDDDVYLFGNTVIIDGTVKGDAIAMAQRVIVNGTVEGNLEAAAASVTVNGRVGRNVRAVGYAVNLGPQARVGKDTLVGGWSLITAPGSVIQGDVMAGTYQARLEGEIGQDYDGSHTALDLNGSVGGNVSVEISPDSSSQTVNPAMFIPGMQATSVPRVAPGFRVGDNAQIHGSLSYTSPVAAAISSSAQISGPVQQTTNVAAEQARQAAAEQAAYKASPQARLLDFLRRWVTLLIVGLLLVWLAWPLMSSAAVIMTERLAASVGWGVAALVGTPFVLLLLILVAVILGITFGLMTLSGLSVASVVGALLASGGLLFAFLTAVAWVSKVVVGIALGRAIFARTSPAGTGSRWWPMLLGVSLLAFGLWALSFIPYLGGLADLVITVLGLGALVVAAWNRWRPTVATPASPAITPIG
ncbi:MAG: polymer-forming cytoskeletal protein [Anaerolineae bacterium]|nr:polymer-forming cytoskeletal protein [Anaerolineae bacterium]